MNTYNYAGIDVFDINNGTGFGVTVFMQGCPHHCKGCHNPSTWDFGGGKPIDINVIDKLLRVFRDPNITRLTLSGGEPFDNIAACITIAGNFKAIKQGKAVWIYTGYTYEELTNIPGARDLLELCDVLVDGPFVIEKKDLSLPFRGSSNQRIIDMNKTRASGCVTLMQI